MKTPYCKNCGKPMIKRSGKYGNFWGCSGYPNCKTLLSMKDYFKEYGKEEEPKKIEIKPESSIVWNEYQVKFHNEVKALLSGESIELISIAGSGKTRTIKHIAALLSPEKKILYVAFSRDIKKALLESEVSSLPNVTVKTFNGLGDSMLRKAYGKKCKLEEHKTLNIVKSILTDDFKPIFKAIVDIIGYLKNSLLEPTSENIAFLIDKHDIEIHPDFTSIFLDSIPKVYGKGLEEPYIYDYNDQVFLPVKLGLYGESFDMLITDESQDTNPAQIELLKISGKPSSNYVFVGDPMQSIYAFRGADFNSMDNLRSAFNCKVMNLSINYRCSRAVGRLVNESFPEIPFIVDSKIEGSVKTIKPEEMKASLKTGDMVLCRVNAPLVKPCYDLIKQGIKAIIKGKDIGKDILSLIGKLHLQSENISELLGALDDYYQKESIKLLKANREDKLSILEDKMNTIDALSEDIYTIPELITKIDTIFSDDIEGIVFSSIHKAKGLESDNVSILKPELIPHPRAKKDWQIIEEEHLKYVAYTRAKVNLYFVIEEVKK